MHEIPRVAIIGVTGFIGRGLPALFADKGMKVTGISRTGKHAELPGIDQWQSTDDLDFSGHHAVVNLAGEPIDQRWTDTSRRLFRESRVGLTSKVVEAFARLPEHDRPQVLVNGSAVGFYGDRGDEILTEKSTRGDGYLADLCVDWEDAARDAESLGLRVVLLRTGVVLGKGGSAFEKIRKVFKLGLGGRIGSGRQWMPWVHVADVQAAIVHAVTSENLTGPLNVAAPVAERNADYTRKLAAAMHRPAIFPVPAFALRLVVGDFANALLSGQRPLPAALEADGFRFQFPDLESALRDLI